MVVTSGSVSAESFRRDHFLLSLSFGWRRMNGWGGGAESIAHE
jgi:hypothetical protein